MNPVEPDEDRRRRRFSQKGEPLANRIRNASSENPDGCWVWQGRISNTGYGAMTVAGRTRSAHRVSFETFVGPIPEGLVIDHLCRERRCVNPEHLDAVTNRVNVMRSSITLGTINAAKTHCPQGHLYAEENTIVVVQPNVRRRHCRACLRAYRQRARARQSTAPSREK